jgi:hypothetical protein
VDGRRWAVRAKGKGVDGGRKTVGGKGEGQGRRAFAHGTHGKSAKKGLKSEPNYFSPSA